MVNTLQMDSAADGEFKVTGFPVKFSESKPSVRINPPLLGQHTEEVLAELGITGKRVDELRRQGVV
ncbi:hypothetical protein CISG_04286 [Coccidioides immitis RMSCC 3703]|nr:hypothetical protein CISG_04286 [Coccidioides immitis RMSCC 3703]